MGRNAPMNLFSKRSASVKYTTVAEVKLFRVYIESLTNAFILNVFKRAAEKKISKRDRGLFCLYSECT